MQAYFRERANLIKRAPSWIQPRKRLGERRKSVLGSWSQAERRSNALSPLNTEGISVDLYIDDFYGAESSDSSELSFLRMNSLFAELGLMNAPEKDTPRRLDQHIRHDFVRSCFPCRGITT